MSTSFNSARALCALSMALSLHVSLGLTVTQSAAGAHTPAGCARGCGGSPTICAHAYCAPPPNCSLTALSHAHASTLAFAESASAVSGVDCTTAGCLIAAAADFGCAA